MVKPATSDVCFRIGGLKALDDLEGVVNIEVAMAIPEVDLASFDVGVVIFEVGVANSAAANFEVGVANLDMGAVILEVGVACTGMSVSRPEVGVAVLMGEHTGCTVWEEVTFPGEITSCAKSTVLSANISSISSHWSVSNTSCPSREQEVMSLSLSFDALLGAGSLLAGRGVVILSVLFRDPVNLNVFSFSIVDKLTDPPSLPLPFLTHAFCPFESPASTSGSI